MIFTCFSPAYSTNVETWIYTELTEYIPKLSHPFHTCIIYKRPWLSCHPNISQKILIQALVSILTSYSSTGSPAKNLPRSSPLFMIPSATSLAIPPYWSVHHSNSSRPSFSSTYTMSERAPSSRLMKVVKFPVQNTSCNSVLTMKFLSMPLVVIPLQ